MAAINYSSVMEKLYAWERSPKGQQKIKSTVNKYIRSNVERTQAGSKVLTTRKMIELGDKLVQSVRQSAVSSGLPSSVAAHFSSLKRGRVTPKGDGSFEMEINFTDDLSRESLQPQTYGGITNIIAIFNNGYPHNGTSPETISHVAGEWHGEYTTALGYRTGLYFMQRAVNDFNATYGAQYNIYAELDAVYDNE